jgi:hypothetical protein
LPRGDSSGASGAIRRQGDQVTFIAARAVQKQQGPDIGVRARLETVNKAEFGHAASPADEDAGAYPSFRQ